jgi:hypothetical protein
VTRVLATLALLLLLAAPAAAQPSGDPDTWRLPGSRTATPAEARRYATGVDELQPKIGRPAGFQELSAGEAGEVLAALRSELVEKRSLESLRPGLEDFRAVMGRLDAAAKASGGAISLETMGRVHGLPIKAVHVSGAPNADGSPRPRILVLGGVHSGTEKAGFEAATRLVEDFAKNSALRARFDITVVPLANPTALVLGMRENAKGVDINRTYLGGEGEPESRVLTKWVGKQRAFDVSLDLHTAGDPGRDGFFLIRGQKDGGLGARIMQDLPSAALLDAKGKPGEARVGPYILYGVGLSEIESIKGTTMDLVRENGTRFAYTFEAPTRANPKIQVDLTMRFLYSALEKVAKHVPADRPALRVREGLKRYRRADGTLKWQEIARQRALPEVAGLAHFGLALFLKEVAAVAATGDRVRIEEFFDGLMTTDFYKHYGLFVAGARLGEVAYAKTLQRYVKPRFVNGLLKTNLVLAAGIALPQIVEGTFEGRAFAISLGSLGLSSAAVRAGTAGIKWVMDLKKVRGTGILTRVGLSRIGRVGGWVYTAAELAVVLYVAEEVEGRINAHLALKEARAELARAGRTLIDAAADPGATPASLKTATAAYRQAGSDYRSFLYAPLHQDEALLTARMERLARQAKLLAARRVDTLEHVEQHEGLRRNVEGRHGTLEAYADSLLARDEAALQAKVDAVLASYGRDRGAHLSEVYTANKRGEKLLGSTADLGWLLSGARAGASGDPFGARRDPYARWGRQRARKSLTHTLQGTSQNRIQAYDDERELLAALAATHSARPHLASVLRDASQATLRVQEADRRLIAGVKQGLQQRVR